MADRCAGCTNKFKFREKPTVCAKCHRNFCSLCIPPAKHKKHKKDRSATPVRDTCVYCTRQLQEALKAQEAEVMENFPERFYHSPHLVPQVQSRVQLDEEKLRAAASQAGRGLPQPTMTEEDRKLEERLRKLKESHKTTTPTYSEEDLHGRLAKLRDEPEGGAKSEEKNSQPPPPPPSTSASDTKPHESGAPFSGGLPQPDRTQTEQATDLLGQMSDRVKLDQRMEQTNQYREEELRSRFQALTGKKVSSDDSTSSSHSQQLEDSIHKFLSGLEVQIEDEDPEKLLEDFKKFQAKEEQAALIDATSSDVQTVVEKAKELHQQEEDETGEETNVLITPYPELPPSMEGEDTAEGKISETEIAKVLEVAKKEMKEEAREKKEIDDFVSETSQRLGKLRGEAHQDEEGDDVVRSKLDPRGGLEQSTLDFSWGHFGQDGRAYLETSGGVGDSAARQLGITLSGDSLDDSEVARNEVEDLIKRMTAEAALDSKLEEKGLDRYLESSSRPEGAIPSQRMGDKVAVTGATASGSGGGAAAATNSASGWAWGDSNDLPWCCICNTDAQIRCYDCDDDLYCMQCFSEGHEQFGLFDHKYAPFEPPSSRAV